MDLEILLETRKIHLIMKLADYSITTTTLIPNKSFSSIIIKIYLTPLMAVKTHHVLRHKQIKIVIQSQSKHQLSSTLIFSLALKHYQIVFLWPIHLLGLILCIEACKIIILLI